MLSGSELVAFVASSDLARSRQFYGDVLGLRFLEQGPYACVFDAHGTMLRVTAVAHVSAAPHTVLGWRVADIRASVEALAGRGVAFTRYDAMDQDELGVWSTPGGDKVAWFTDPDRNTLSLTQFVTA